MLGERESWGAKITELISFKWLFSGLIYYLFCVRPVYKMTLTHTYY